MWYSIENNTPTYTGLEPNGNALVELYIRTKQLQMVLLAMSIKEGVSQNQCQLSDRGRNIRFWLDELRLECSNSLTL